MESDEYRLYTVYGPPTTPKNSTRSKSGRRKKAQSTTEAPKEALEVADLANDEFFFRNMKRPPKKDKSIRDQVEIISAEEPDKIEANSKESIGDFFKNADKDFLAEFDEQFHRNSRVIEGDQGEASPEESAKLWVDEMRSRDIISEFNERINKRINQRHIRQKFPKYQSSNFTHL